MQLRSMLFASTLLLLPASIQGQLQEIVFVQGAGDEEILAVKAGGSVQVDINDECDYGFISRAEDAVALSYAGIGGTLHVYAEGEGDLMLVVLTPDSTFLCDDDSHEGLNPLVSIPDPEIGVYGIWVGGYSEGAISQATLHITTVDPGGTATAGAPNLASEPTYGRITLDGSFTPDPHTLTLSAGGSVDVDVSGCGYGFVASAPDYNLTYAGGSDLSFYVRSDEDTTLLINRPDASWICDDDSLGDSNPVVTIPNAPSGLYNIWVGTYSDGDLVSATLYISKKAPK